MFGFRVTVKHIMKQLALNLYVLFHWLAVLHVSAVAIASHRVSGAELVTDWRIPCSETCWNQPGGSIQTRNVELPSYISSCDSHLRSNSFSAFHARQKGWKRIAYPGTVGWVHPCFTPWPCNRVRVGAMVP